MIFKKQGENLNLKGVEYETYFIEDKLKYYAYDFVYLRSIDNIPSWYIKYITTSGIDKILIDSADYNEYEKAYQRFKREEKLKRIFSGTEFSKEILDGNS